MDFDKLVNQLFFSKEAADYLGISVQRLNQLVHENKIIPMKKNASGTLFHIDELNRRKTELSIFDVNTNKGGGKGMFEIDNQTKQEAVNFATLMNILNCAESKVEPELEKLAELVDLASPLDDPRVCAIYAKQLGLDCKCIIDTYKSAYIAFTLLKNRDEIIKRGSPDYPPLLAETEQAPRFLYIRGRKSLLFETRTVSLVGSRKASDKAKENTRKIAKLLGENGITVISGLAKGIDIAAHRAALDCGYNTIAVIGTSLNQYYPSENMNAQLEIEEKGLVVSQFSPASITQRWFFPLRNGVMSGLSLATVIMEAGETSGALKQADFALKQGRQILIPESAIHNTAITWPQRYVDKGAQVVRTSTDIIRALAENKIFKVQQRNGDIYTGLAQQSIEDFIQSRENQPNEPRKWKKSVIPVE